jgi:protein-S-isoprenylcysteine O-methyltransferase Ste14
MPPDPGGYGVPQPRPPSKIPLILSIIGIVCWLVFSPAAIVLGLIAQVQYRKQGERDTLAKVAWIGGIIVLALGIILAILQHRTVPAHSG